MNPLLYSSKRSIKLFLIQCNGMLNWKFQLSHSNMKFPRKALSQNLGFKRRYQRTSQMDPKPRYKKDQALGGEYTICEDMICQLFHLFPGKRAFTRTTWRAQIHFLEWEMIGLTDLEQRRSSRLIWTRESCYSKAAKEENQLQTFASFTREAGLMWNYLPPIPFLPLSSIPITHSISNNSLQVSNMWARRIAKDMPLSQRKQLVCLRWGVEPEY